MYYLSQYTVLMFFSIVLFVFGLTCLSAGVWQLFIRAHSKEVDQIAIQASDAVQKGLADEFSSLILGASELVDAFARVVKTRAGIGVFLCLVGGALIGTAILIVKSI